MQKNKGTTSRKMTCEVVLLFYVLNFHLQISPARDLLSLLVRANVAVDIPSNQRLSDEDIIARKSSQSHAMRSSKHLPIY